MSTSSIDIQREFTVTSVADRTDYLDPSGAFFSSLLPWSLEVDRGDGFVALDADPLTRVSAPVSVSDLAIGFRLKESPEDGWRLRFRWKERRILVAPGLAATAVRLNGGELDNSVAWSYRNPSKAPNGVVFPRVEGAKVEFWRLTRHVGGSRGGGKARLGRRYVPYLRGEQDVFSFDASAILSSHGKTRKFRACYVTEDGSRSDLCWGAIIVSRSGTIKVIK